MTRKSQRMRMPRSEAEAWRAMEATSPGPWPTARKTSSSIAALSAAVRWKAWRFSKTMPGVRAGAGGDCIVRLLVQGDGVRLREPEEYRGYWGVVKPVEDGGNLEEGRFLEIRDEGVRHCGAPMALGEVAKRNAGKDRRRDATLTREYGVSRQDTRPR